MVEDRAASAKLNEVPGSEKIWPADLVLLATGFLGPEQYVAEMLGVETRPAARNFKAEHGKFATNVPKRVRRRRLPPRPIARRLGHQRRPRRRRAIDEFLMGTSTLPAPGITQGMLAGVIAVMPQAFAKRSPVPITRLAS